VTIDAYDNLIVTGKTRSEAFPVLYGYDETLNGVNDDVFVTKFSSFGTLIWSTYFGGSSYDACYSVTVDSQDAIFITGVTDSSDFPVLNGFDDTLNETMYSGDAFVTKFDFFGDLVWSSYLGGSDAESGKTVVIDSEDNVLFSGTTSSSDFPVFNGYAMANNGFYDIYITKILNNFIDNDTDDDEISINTFMITISSFALVILLYRRKKRSY